MAEPIDIPFEGVDSACYFVSTFVTISFIQLLENESVPKIIINNTVNFFPLNCNYHFDNFNHKCFRVLFASIYFI